MKTVEEVVDIEVDEWWSLYLDGEFVLRSPTSEEATNAFHILRAALPDKYMGKHIEWQRCLLGKGARGDIVSNFAPEKQEFGVSPIADAFDTVFLLSKMKDDFARIFGVPREWIE